MAKTLVISPVTRINGFWRLDVQVEGGRIVDAQSSGIYIRGMELILQKRDPRDAVYLSQRICGICSSAHAMAGSLAFEQAYHIRIPHNGMVIRNLIFGADLLQNHIRHFYFLVMPDFVKGPEEPPFIPRYESDYRFTKQETNRLNEHFLQSIDISRLCHEMLVIFGGKVPHNHGILIGGASVPPNADNVRLFLSRLERIRTFIEERLLPDMELLSRKYEDYYHLGIGPQRFLTYGMFPNEEKPGEFHLPPGVLVNGQLTELKPDAIHEMVKYSWYRDEDRTEDIMRGETHLDPDKPGAYSWIKAPRYQGQVMETGPLARARVSGSYTNGVSVMDRLYARVLEAKKVAALMQDWLNKLEPGKPIYTDYEPLRNAQGIGLTDAMRGTLGHWVEVENYHVKSYQIITPSAWNMSPRDDHDQPGAVETALIGTPIADTENPVEVGRVARSFDPCSSCATHVYTPDGRISEYMIP